jgi:RES domain-containing protein
MRLWRLIKTKYAESAFDGEGARLHGGRWNSPGTLVAYASDSSALAVLEVLVNLKDDSILSSYSLVSATTPDKLIETLDRRALPPNWSSSPIPPAVQAIGDKWARSKSSLALRVPSAIVEASDNLLINPAHSEFDRFEVTAIDAFKFDKRLMRKSKA